MPDELRGRYTFQDLRQEYDVDPQTRPQDIQLSLSDAMLSVSESDMDEAMQYAVLGQLAGVMSGLNKKWTGGRQRSFHFTEMAVMFE